MPITKVESLPRRKGCIGNVYQRPFSWFLNRPKPWSMMFIWPVISDRDFNISKREVPIYVSRTREERQEVILSNENAVSVISGQSPAASREPQIKTSPRPNVSSDISKELWPFSIVRPVDRLLIVRKSCASQYQQTGLALQSRSQKLTFYSTGQYKVQNYGLISNPLPKKGARTTSSLIDVLATKPPATEPTVHLLITIGCFLPQSD